MNETPTGPRRRKGTRPKHVPMRTCVVCRESDAKRAYVRIVRTPEGTVEIDRTGKRNGRGAYLCARFSCWDRAAAGTALDRALRVDVPDEVRLALRVYADHHFRRDGADEE